MRVLVVDDEQRVRETVWTLLCADGYTVEMAPDAPAALELLHGGAFDIIVSDIFLPEINGIELLKSIRSAAPFAQVIMMTGEPSIDTAAEALRWGAFDYLIKPVRQGALLRAVGNAGKIKALDDDRRRLQQEREEHLQILERQNEELRRAAEFREEVEAVTRHDLKSPLNLILGLPQLLLDMSDNLTEKQREMLGRIEAAGRRMLDMINLSLDMFRIEQGMYTLQPGAVDLLEVANEVLKHQEMLSRVQKVSTRIHLEGRTPTSSDHAMIQGERLLCYSMLGNLVKNALEASPAGGNVDLDLGTGDTVTVAIRNPGSVPPNIRDRFFEKYISHGKKHGTGLGTYSARLMAEAQGGLVHVDCSKEGETTVVVSFPAPRPAAEGRVSSYACDAEG